MTTDDSNRQGTSRPLPKFHFQVKIGDDEAGFAEISGLDIEPDVVEFRQGNSKPFGKTKQPEMLKYSNLTFKRGIFSKSSIFQDWITDIQLNSIKQETIIISLLDESGKPVAKWTVSNAWPTKITGTDLKSDGNEVAVESIEIAYQGFTIDND